MANINADGVYQDNLGNSALGTSPYKCDKVFGTLNEKKDREVYDRDATSITIPAHVIVEVGGKVDALEVAVEPALANVPSLVWQSSDETVATVNELGEIIGVKTGTATVKATDVENGAVTAQTSVEVFAAGAVPTYSVTLTANDAEMGTVEGSAASVVKYAKVAIKATPAEGYVFEKWSDNDTNAAREIVVSQNVTLTATFKAAE